MRVSIIIITLNEADNLERTIAAARAAGCFDSDRVIPVEIVVSDGGSTDATVAIAESLADKVVEAPRGRSNQLNAGARVATGDILLFLHADTLLPKGGIAYLLHAFLNPALIGGGFEKTWKWSRRVARSRFVMFWSYMFQGTGNWVSTFLKKLPGDNALFVRRPDFEVLGGFKNLWLCEDFDFSRRMVALGHARARGWEKFQLTPRVDCIQQYVSTSARRFEISGFLKTVASWFVVYFLWRVGIPQDRIQRLFKHYSTVPERPNATYVKI
jgi:glycosyltransferase involved in cell wall biosynthesis